MGRTFRAFALAFAVAASSAAAAPLEHPASHEALLRESAREGSVVVVLFSLEGCAYCEALRRDQLVHLARERRLRFAEYEIGERRAFEPAPADGSPPSPAALARSLQVRVAPTVVFLGADGSEIAERLVGYASPDFYGAFLERRLGEARARLAGR